MNEHSTPVERQNDVKALTLLRASSKCLSNERKLKYLMITLSFLICIIAIFNRYLLQILGDTELIREIQTKTSTYLNLISGAVLVAGMPIGFHCSRMHTEGTVLRDRYDAFVFDNPSNLSILRPVSEDYIGLLARKTPGTNKKFCNYIYNRDDKVDEATAQFEYISKEAHFDYNLYLSVQPFFVTIWVGFCLLIILIAVSFNDMFITTLINIMIPSLSAITTIGNSWYNCRLQMRQLANLLSVIDQIQSMPIEKRQQYIANKENMRLLADGLYNYRVSPFVIPNFLIRRHKKTLARIRKSGKLTGIELAKISPVEESAAPASENEEAPETFKIMPAEAGISAAEERAEERTEAKTPPSEKPAPEEEPVPPPEPAAVPAPTPVPAKPVVVRTRRTPSVKDPVKAEAAISNSTAKPVASPKPQAKPAEAKPSEAKPQPKPAARRTPAKKQ